MSERVEWVLAGCDECAGHSECYLSDVDFPCADVIYRLSVGLQSAARYALIVGKKVDFALYLRELADEVYPPLPF